MNHHCEAPDVTAEIAAVTPRARRATLVLFRAAIAQAWRDGDAAALRDMQPHFLALDWLVRNGAQFSTG